MQIGLLGKANVGKSTFFAASTATPVAVGNFPFTTIDPNVGVAHVRAKCACSVLDLTHDVPDCRNGTRLVPVKIIDVAGLVPGAHEGRGLGNKFLDAARQADVLLHVIDAAGATDIQGQPIKPGEHDPAEDAKFVVEEFDAWFSDILSREWQRIVKEVLQKKSTISEGVARRFSGLGIKENDVTATLQSTSLNAKKPNEWTPEDITSFTHSLRELTKPMLVIANKADMCESVPEQIAGAPVVPCCAEAELLLSRAVAGGMATYESGDSSFTVSDTATPQQSKALETVSGILEKLGNTGVQKALNQAVFDVLKMIVVYPVEDESKFSNKDGLVLPRAILLPSGATTLDMAREVHAEIAEGFLYGINCKTKQRVGADSVVNDGDVIKMFSTKTRGG